ncbi:MAG: tetratricopeptide repeat protein [Candidatus Polarisedimenticolia bacterium]
MTRRLLVSAVAAMLCLAPAGSVQAVQKSLSRLQMEFGVKVAMKGSWNEAAFRFEKAILADGANARAYNNLAVARESLGQFGPAREAYEKALELAPKDSKIRQNYDRFLSFYRSILPSQRNAGNAP